MKRTQLQSLVLYCLAVFFMASSEFSASSKDGIEITNLVLNQLTINQKY